MDTYKINQKTLAIISSSNSKKVKIIEQNKTFYVLESANLILENSCRQFGSTLEGRQRGATYLIGKSYKAPIILNEKNNIIFFPTHSIRNQKCCWFALNSILKYHERADKKVLVEFKNRQKIIMNVSFYIFDKQVMKATRLESSIRGRNSVKML